MTRRLGAGGALALICAALAVGGCGSSSSSSSSSASSSTTAGSSSAAGGGSAPAADPKIAALVPAAVKSKGTITVAADATYAPNEFIGSDGHTVQGMDVDLMHAIGGLMGVKVNVVNQTFDSIIPGLLAGKYDAGASSFTDTKAREKQVDFVDYFTAGESFYTKASGGATVTSLAGACGKTVAVEKGTTEESDATKQKCTGAKITVLSFPDQNGANLAVSSGRAQLGFADSPVAAYAVKKSGGQFKLVGSSLSNAPYGLALPKAGKLAPAVQAAVKSLIASGQYKTILSKWGVQGGAITADQAKINGATS